MIVERRGFNPGDLLTEVPKTDPCIELPNGYHTREVLDIRAALKEPSRRDPIVRNMTGMAMASCGLGYDAVVGAGPNSSVLAYEIAEQLSTSYRQIDSIGGVVVDGGIDFSLEAERGLLGSNKALVVADVLDASGTPLIQELQLRHVAPVGLVTLWNRGGRAQLVADGQRVPVHALHTQTLSRELANNGVCSLCPKLQIATG